MSGNAALAAAKRRRNPAMASNAGGQNMQQLQKPVRKVQSIPELVVEHDRKIFILEKKLEDTQNNGGNIDEGQNIAVANSAENMAKTNAAEIKMLKSTVAKQAKSLSDVQSLLTTLRATLNTQAAELTSFKSLKDDVDALKKTPTNNNETDEDEETEEDGENDTKVELKVNDK